MVHMWGTTRRPGSADRKKPGQTYRRSKSKSRQTGWSGAGKLVAHESKNLKLNALMDRQPVKGILNESGYNMDKPRDATYKPSGGVKDIKTLQEERP